MKHLFHLCLIFLFIAQTSTRTKEEWKQRSIYQVLTDRIATSNGSSPSCALDQYCGGTWKGLESKLDYIAGMSVPPI